MADISILSRLLDGVQRNVNLSSNTLVVGSLKVGSVSPTELTKAILDRLVSLQNGTDVDATYHTHDGRYYTETELSDATGPTTGSDLIGDDDTYSNFTPSAATVKGALEGIDAALSVSGGQVKVSVGDTTPAYLDDKIVAGAGLSSTILNDDADEDLSLSVNVDDSTIEINSDALRVKDAGITNAKIATGVDAAKIADGSVSNTEFQYLSNVTSDIQTQINAKANDNIVIKKDGSVAFTAAQSMGGFKLTNVADPTVAQDAATKAYVDAVSLGLKPKTAVRVASTANVVIATALENGDTLDGVTLATGDRVLLKNQTLPEQNGIYVVVASGAASRSTDFDSLTPIDEINGAWVAVQEGTANAGHVYVQVGTVATLDTDPINFTYWDPIASLTGGDMVTKTGNDLSVDLATDAGLESSNPGNAAGQLRVKLDGATLARSSSGLKVADAGITETQLATSVAGDGLTGGAGSPLAVGAGDGIDVTANAIAVDVGDLAGSGLENDGSNNLRIAASAAGAGLTGGAGSPLAVGEGDGIDVAADAISVNVSELAGSGLEDDGSNNLRISTAAAGAGLTGGGGSALSVAYAPRGLRSAIAGESMAANTSFLVRWAVDGETAGRAYKADKNAATTHLFYAWGIALKTSAVSAGDAVDVTFEGTHTLGASDTPFNAADIGKAVYLTAAGAFSVTAPSSTDEAVWRIGIVQATNMIWVGGMQLNGIN